MQCNCGQAQAVFNVKAPDGRTVKLCQACREVWHRVVEGVQHVERLEVHGETIQRSNDVR